MNTLPVAARELRVAARKRSTFWIRVAAASTAFLIGAAFMVVTMIGGNPVTSVGRALFTTLSWLSMAAALSAGLFLTSDCISLEKREGTLGLLFLTSLRGYDVVAGKLVATSMRGLYALLAVLPMLAITQLMGGIQGGDYWRAALALVNGLFFSLATGMLVSALSRDAHRAMMWTLLVLLIFIFGGPIADALLATLGTGGGYRPFWSATSPGYVLVSASSMSKLVYWVALGTTHSVGWVFLGMTCALTPHTWQDRARRSGSQSMASYSWRYGTGGWRARLRQRLLDKHPVSWLLGRERWAGAVLWFLALALAAALIAALVWDSRSTAWIAWNYLGGFLALLLYFWAAAQAGRFFTEARRTGLLELLLASPVNERQIVAGQWHAWKRTFALPLLLLISVHVTGVALSQVSFFSIASQAAAAPAGTAAGGTNSAGVKTASSGVVGVTVTGTAAKPNQGDWMTKAKIVATATATGTAAAVTVLSNIAGLLWFGMWMGVTSRTANIATLKTFAFVQVIPYLIISFGSSFLMGLLLAGFLWRAGTAQPAAMIAFMPLLTTVFGALMAVIKNIGFVVWSRKKLYSSLRTRAAMVLGDAPAAVVRLRGQALPPPLPPGRAET